MHVEHIWSIPRVLTTRSDDFKRFGGRLEIDFLKGIENLSLIENSMHLSRFMVRNFMVGSCMSS